MDYHVPNREMSLEREISLPQVEMMPWIYWWKVDKQLP
jgi:hypothetical protein